MFMLAILLYPKSDYISKISVQVYFVVDNPPDRIWSKTRLILVTDDQAHEQFRLNINELGDQVQGDIIFIKYKWNSLLISRVN